MDRCAVAITTLTNLDGEVHTKGDVTGRAQLIRCAKCGEVIALVTGDGRFCEGWMPCPVCMVDTRIVNARESGECRPTELLSPSPSIRKTDSKDQA